MARQLFVLFKILQYLTVGYTLITANDVFIVSSEVLQPGGAPPITLLWRVVHSDVGFLIYDITVEGVSMAITQRSEFASVIRNGGGKISALIVALSKKTKELSNKNAGEMGSTN